MESLVLIDKLCACYESLPDAEGSAAEEMMRVIRAVATDDKVTLMSEGPVASILSSRFGEDKILWSHVELSSVES